MSLYVVAFTFLAAKFRCREKNAIMNLSFTVDEHPGYFQRGAVMNSTAVNIQSMTFDHWQMLNNGSSEKSCDTCLPISTV